MDTFIPEFNLARFLQAPWDGAIAQSNLWVVLMGALVAGTCGLVGQYLILRRMALIGDAISHSVLPGIAIAFLVSGSRGSGAMFVGALAAGVATTLIIEIIHKKTRVKQDSAIGIAFTSLFAIGVILINIYASRVDLDQECVLYGEIGMIPLEPVSWFGLPESVLRMAGVGILTILLIVIFYKELLVSSFDPGLAVSLGIRAGWVHYGLMCWLSIVVVSAFESVGAILVIAMLILPGATASLVSHKLPVILSISVIFAVISSLAGIHLATWLDCSIAGAMVVAASALFAMAWLLSPQTGLIAKITRRKPEEPEPALATLETPRS